MKIENRPIGAIQPYGKNAKKDFTCKNCSKVWSDFQSNDKNKQYCSIKCKSEYSRTDRVCRKCCNTFSICKSTLEKSNSTGNYCSRKCYVESMTTGLTKNKNGFRTISEKIRKKNPFCAICGTFKRIHIHHIEPYRYTKNNDESNLIPLCISHHKIVEIQTEKLLILSPIQEVSIVMKNILRSRQLQTYSLIYDGANLQITAK